MRTTIAHGLKLLRNFFPILIGHIGGIYFAVKYFVLLSQYPYSEATRMIPLSETPEVFILFYISAGFLVGGYLVNTLWIYILAKLEVS